VTKMLRIEACYECKHRTWYTNRADCKVWLCLNPDTNGALIPHHDAIPAWCPLPDAPAWPRVAEADEEREGDGILEVAR